jgi:hypothetical protein
VRNAAVMKTAWAMSDAPMMIHSAGLDLIERSAA